MTHHKKLENGFEYIEVQNQHAEAKIALQGAHLFHYQAKGKSPLLWLSELANFQESKAIRGGVPICFPWFGPNQEDRTLPQHGFARNLLWKFMGSYELADGSTHLQFMLNANKATRALWDYGFVFFFEVTIGTELTMKLTTTNVDIQPFEITQALHSYFNISHIKNVSVEGLERAIYYSNLDKQLYRQEGVITVEEEVDRVYFDTLEKITLVDTHQKIELNQEGSKSLVVWNPWIEKSEQMADMPNNAYETMFCLESANALKDFKLLRPNESHSLKVTISQSS